MSQCLDSMVVFCHILSHRLSVTLPGVVEQSCCISRSRRDARDRVLERALHVSIPLCASKCCESQHFEAL